VLLLAPCFCFFIAARYGGCNVGKSSTFGMVDFGFGDVYVEDLVSWILNAILKVIGKISNVLVEVVRTCSKVLEILCN